MKMKYNSIALIAITASIILIGSCKKDREPEYSVPAELESYITLFEQEAATRGIDMNIDDLVVAYGQELEDNGTEAAGLCHYETKSMAPFIELDTTSFNWEAHEYSREALVFHELGHCILERRSHNNALLSNKNYKSIMKATGEPSYAGFNYFKRAYYLDELFEPNTPEPWWASTTANAYSNIAVESKQTIYNDEFDNNLNGWTLGQGQFIRTIENGKFHLENIDDSPYFISDFIDIQSNSGNWEIETSIKISEGSNFAVCLVFGGAKSTSSSGPKLNYYGYNNVNDAIILDTETGDYVSSPSSFIDFGEFNKLTIRKTGNYLYYYINEQYYNITEYQEFYGGEFGFLVPSQNTVEVDYLNVYSID